MSCSSERGQASVELVGFLPVAVTVMLAAAQLLAAGLTRELADHAAQAGAMALVQGGSPQAAAREAVPGWSRDRLRVRVAGRRVGVRLEPPTLLPGAPSLLVARASADAGPLP